MVGGLGDGSHGLHARKSRAALDQARAGKAEAPRTRTDGEERRHGRFALVDAGASGTDNLRKPCLPGAPAKVPASALIAERSALPHQVDEQPDGCRAATPNRCLA
jgi:hypothetical protein